MPSPLRDAKGHFISSKSQTKAPPAIVTTKPAPPRPRGSTEVKSWFLFLFAIILGVVAFQVGRFQALNRNLPATRVGILKVTDKTNPPRYFLLEKSGQVISLEIPQNLDVATYQNRRVIVSGTLNDATGTLILATANDLERAPAAATAISPKK